MADSFEMKLFGSDELMAKLQALQGYFQGDVFKGVLNDAGQMYVNLAKRDAPISKSPGATGLVAGGSLRNSINYQVQEFGTPNVTLRVGAGGPGARYASYVEEGTRDSIRVAVNARMMHWVEDGVGRTVNIPFTGRGGAPSGWVDVYAAQVWHPGTRPQPFFFKHADNVANRLIMAIQRTINAEFAKQTK